MNRVVVTSTLLSVTFAVGLMSKNMPQPVVPVSHNGGSGAVGYTYIHSTYAGGDNIVWNSNSIITGYTTGASTLITPPSILKEHERGQGPQVKTMEKYKWNFG